MRAAVNITETFRIRPAAWLFSRVAVVETVLGNHTLPAGADILISPYLIHHRSDLFSNPERFDPQRWSSSSQDRISAERNATMVMFGFGPRKCIGRDFTITNITLAIASILKSWKLTPATTKPVSISGRSIIEPRGLLLRLHHRKYATNGSA